MKQLILLLILCTSFSGWSQSWVQTNKAVASDRFTNDEFGFAVAMDGDYAIIGARLEDEDTSGNNAISQAGSAYVFKKDSNGNWNQYQKLIASDRSFNHEFGTSVDISGDRIIVGAPENVAGAAYVYELIGSTWTEVAKLEASDGVNNDLFGFSVAIDNDAIIIGAYNEEEDKFGNNSLDESGSAYIFERINGTWQETEKLVAADREDDDWFGYSVDISGDFAVIGAYKEDHDAVGNNFQDTSGSAYIFHNAGGAWSQVQKIVSHNFKLMNI